MILKLTYKNDKLGEEISLTTTGPNTLELARIAKKTGKA
jgi:hypothetical protein